MSRLRPTFVLDLEEGRLETIRKMADSYPSSVNKSLYQLYGEYGEIHLRPEEHRLWSPHLSFYINEEEGHARLHGRFAPRMEVWTFVWIVYLAMAFSAFFGLALAYSQWMVGDNPWGIWVTIAGLSMIAALYLAADIGQQLSSDQMHALREQLERVLEKAQIRWSVVPSAQTLPATH